MLVLSVAQRCSWSSEACDVDIYSSCPTSNRSDHGRTGAVHAVEWRREVSRAGLSAASGAADRRGPARRRGPPLDASANLAHAPRLGDSVLQIAPAAR